MYVLPVAPAAVGVGVTTVVDATQRALAFACEVAVQVLVLATRLVAEVIAVIVGRADPAVDTAAAKSVVLTHPN